ncbi:MAG: hypothetical protein J6S85_12565 [Methanobrevibacter sp.]|nr:hypothetical protein [Methanobrevibacter sp.]
MELVLLVGGKKFIEELKKIAKKADMLEVGFFPVSTYGNGLPVAQVAYWQEYGTYNIPTRPFFRTAIKNNSLAYGISFGLFLKEYKYDIDLAFERLGDKVKKDIQDSIHFWSTPPNAEITVNGGWMKNKKSGKVFKVDGKGFNDPLTWNGNLEDSVRWKYGDESA